MARRVPAQMDRVRRGEIPWTRLDALHRNILEGIIPAFGLERLSEDERGWLNSLWHRLPAWPDSASGLARLRKRYVAATLSNGDVSMLVDIARFAGLTRECVLSAELARHFKPDRETYLTAAELLHLPPSKILLVAAHFDDLAGAHRAGLRTAYVARSRGTPQASRRRRSLKLRSILKRKICTISRYSWVSRRRDRSSERPTWPIPGYLKLVNTLDFILI